MRARFSILMVLAAIVVACSGPVSSGNATSDGSMEADVSVLTGPPAVVLPESYPGAPSLLITRSGQEAPPRFYGAFTPIGPVWDISIKDQADVDFSPETASLRFSYDPVDVAGFGLIEEFLVLGLHDGAGSADDPNNWQRVESTRTEKSAGENTIVGETSHFSGFVVVASAPAASSVVPVPELDPLFPTGIGGSAGVSFSKIDESFTYYLDREYTIVPATESPENSRTFDALGLDGSIGISTYNGGTVAEPISEHKHYSGPDYILFDAHMDLDVYLLYDSRGGGGPGDTTQDATWIDALGFESEIDGEEYFMETTDPVGLYRVYRKGYSRGETVRLHGNHYDMDTTDGDSVDISAIQTNYWLILKPMGNTESDSADTVTDVDTIPPQEVQELRISTGNHEATFTWLDPPDADFSRVEILYGTPEADTLYSGVTDPSGTTIAGLVGDRVDYEFVIRTTDIYGNRSTGIRHVFDPWFSQCGNGVTEELFSEECDDGNQTDGDACTWDCKIDDSFAPEVTDLAATAGMGSITLSWINPHLGFFDRVELFYGSPAADTLFSGVVDPAGTTISGLSNAIYTFTVQVVYWYGFRSPGISFQANPQYSVCGDLVVAHGLGEDCDDGNSSSGDGCSATCRWE